MPAKFLKTSLQLSPAVFEDMVHWPGLTQSEALRLSVERGHYLSCLNSEDIAALADEYEPILMGALEDLDYKDYRLPARSLPAIVAGYVSEEDRRWADSRGGALQPSQLVERIEKMNVLERIGILDCIVAERHRKAEATAKQQQATGKNGRAPNAADFEEELRERWRQAEKSGAPYVDINAGEIHRMLGGYPSRGQNRMANCCQVMMKLRQAHDLTVSSPPKGKGASLVIRYALPRLETKQSP